MKRIVFKETAFKGQELVNPSPTPSVKSLPQWFKKTTPYTTGHRDYLRAKQETPIEQHASIQATFKLCQPVTDSMTAGYTVLLPATLLVTNGPNGDSIPNIEWKTSTQPFDAIPVETLGQYPIPNGYYPIPFRWKHNWKVQTPKGYSLWVTHPSHRNDLPFLTINGFIDTDKHPNSVVFPFFIRKGFEGFIEAGTPIAQLIPMKRESWQSEVAQYTRDEALAVDRVKQHFIKTYKKLYWSKKTYQ